MLFYWNEFKKTKSKFASLFRVAMKSDNTNTKSYSSNFRAKRIKLLSSLLEKRNLKNITILDVGGTINYWEMNLKYIAEGLIAEIDVINLPEQEQTEINLRGSTIRSYTGDALDQSTFRKRSYDLIHSNSVIEHVGNLSAQKKMADSIVNHNAFFWIQTPAKSFPLEPHFYMLFFAYLPLSIRAFLLRKFDLGFHKKEPKWLQSRITCDETRLLSRKEYTHLFMGAQIIPERVLFLTKSYIATNLD